MTDCELLELAAKAAEIVVRWHDDGYYGPTMEIMEDESGGPPWNPLTDDGDALRLAVKLEMDVMCASVRTDCGIVETIQAGTDIYAATRRAIVRAAAAIAQDGGART